MSSLAVNAITDASGGSTATVNGYTPTASNMAGRNRIINGAMMIDQRNTTATVNANTRTYCVDRFAGQGQNTDGVFTLVKDTSAPTGFISSLKATVTTADSSLTTNQRYFITQIIEGSNIADLAWGSASAASVTLSFWVRSSITGTFGGTIKNALSAATQSYPFSYQVSSANTWEYKTVSITGSTAGTWNTDATEGVVVAWSLGASSDISTTANAWASGNYWSATGATNLMATNGATFYITGVQLEVGSVATPFEHRLYGTELALCQRYYEVVGAYPLATEGYYSSAGYGVYKNVSFAVAKRATPTVTAPTPNTIVNINSYAVRTQSTDSFGISGVTTSSGNCYWVFSNTQYITASSEL